MNYQCLKFKSTNGEQGALLVNLDTGIPLFYENLFLTIHHRNKPDAFNSMRTILGILEFLALICELKNIGLIATFRKGELLSESQIESIITWTKKTKCSLLDSIKLKPSGKEFSFKRKKLELARYVVVIDTDMVESKTTYNRLLFISKYLVWLATHFNQASSRDVEIMRARLKIGFPEVDTYDDDPDYFKSLTDSQKLDLLNAVEIDSPTNPWVNEAVRYRNKVMVHILYYIGCRKGELLTLKATDLDPGKKTINIRRDPDNLDDPRTNVPSVKTLGRDVEIDDVLYEMVETYVIKYRSQVRGANRCPYLFLSHQTGAKKASPLSISSVDKVFKFLSIALGFSLNSYSLRHTWNDEFSEDVDAALDRGEISESEAEDLRSYLMGWVEDSGTAKTYTKRYQHKKSMKFGLQLQRKRISKDQDNLSLIKEDIPY